MSGANKAWESHLAHLKRHKNKNHDNYDASKFVSQFRKPLAIMAPNSVADPKSVLNSSTSVDPSSKSHVSKLLYEPYLYWVLLKRFCFTIFRKILFDHWSTSRSRFLFQTINHQAMLNRWAHVDKAHECLCMIQTRRTPWYFIRLLSWAHTSFLKSTSKFRELFWFVLN